MAEKNSENVLEIKNLSVVFDTGEKKIRVITNNGWALDGKYPEGVQLRILGGYVYEHILVGEYAVESLIGLSADKLFVGCAAVYWDGKFRYDIPSEIGINEMMVSRTKGEIYVLADHSKFRRVFSVTFSQLKKCCIITDSLPDQRFAKETVIKEVTK